jgi:hypothetical protein
MCRVHRESLAEKKRLDLALKSFNTQDEPFIKIKNKKKENAGHVLGVLNARPPSKYPPSSIFIFQEVLQLNATGVQSPETGKRRRIVAISISCAKESKCAKIRQYTNIARG